MPIIARFSFTRKLNLGHSLIYLPTTQPGQTREYGYTSCPRSIADQLGLYVRVFCSENDDFGKAYLPNTGSDEDERMLIPDGPPVIIPDFRPIRMPLLGDAGNLVLDLVHDDKLGDEREGSLPSNQPSSGGPRRSAYSWI